MNHPTAQTDSRWPHRMAVLLVCATFPLIWVGGLVTTYEAGMAVPDWPNTFGYNLLLYPWQSWVFGPWDVFVEHGHRLLGALAGMITIALVVVTWRCERRRWVRWMSVGAMAAVIAQGVLGGMRVLLDERLLAQIHGCTGPAFFALAVALAVVTSRRWVEAPTPRPTAGGDKLQRLALITTALAYVQLALGSQIRHIGYDASSDLFRAAVMFHLIVAAALTVHIGLLAARAWRIEPREPSLLRPALWLTALIAAQLALGTGAWIVNFGWPSGVLGRYGWSEGFVIQHAGWLQTLVTTSHVAIGSTILVVALTVTLRSFRLVGRPSRPVAAPRIIAEAVL